MIDVTPFIEHVPKSVEDNLAWRMWMREAALRDVYVQRALFDAAMDDVLFFFNAFLWLQEPRGRIKTLPFVTWPHQDPVILAMDQAIIDAQETEEPLALTIKKSRAQGGTYAYLGVDIRRAIRDGGFSVGLVTRNEKLIDSAKDADTIMYKVAWMLDRLPFWMLPSGYERSLTDHTIALPNGSLFTGYAATGDVARGGRKTKFDFDEPGSEEFISGGKDYKVMSSVSSVSNCTFLVSTFGGENGVFYEAATDPDNPRLETLDWKDNPSQTKNAYVMRDGVPVAVKAEDAAGVAEYARTHVAQLKKLERRGHTMEGKFRSPWYDAYCLLPGATPRFVARELDMDSRGAVGKVFDLDVLDRMKESHCRAPVWQGKPVFDGETLELTGLVRQENGPLKLWFTPGLDNAVPRGRYAMGCDIAFGTSGDKASNSTVCGINIESGQQVLEYATKTMHASKFADVAVALAKWLKNAYLGWESTGPAGSLFEDGVVDRNYWNIYFRDAEVIGSGAKTRKAGWGNYKDRDKATLFDNLCLAMADDEFIPHSTELLIECAEYEVVDGKIVHRPSSDSGMSEFSHGDRCVAAGIANLLRVERQVLWLDKNNETAHDYPYGSLGWRIQQAKAREPKGDDDGLEGGIRELLGMGSNDRE